MICININMSHTHTQSYQRSLNLVIQLERDRNNLLDRLNRCEVQRETAETRLEELNNLIVSLYDYLEFNEEQRKNIKNSIV